MRQMLSLSDLKDMLSWGQKNAKTHMLVICDRVEDEDYLDFAISDEEVQKKVDELANEGCSVTEVYDLNIDFDVQLTQPYTMNYRKA